MSARRALHSLYLLTSIIKVAVAHVTSDRNGPSNKNSLTRVDMPLAMEHVRRDCSNVAGSSGDEEQKDNRLLRGIALIEPDTAQLQ